MTIELPQVTILMTTYAPKGKIGEATQEAAERALSSWKHNLKYEGELGLHVSDDGSDCGGYAISADSPPTTSFWNDHVTFSRQERGGVGASLNAGIRAAIQTSPLLVYLMDDWLLSEELDITPWARLLLEDENCGSVKLGPPHPGSGHIELSNYGWVLKLYREEFAFSLRPALYHRRLFDYYGPFQEGMHVGICEAEYNAKFCADPNGPDIYLPQISPWEWLNEIDGYPRPSLAGLELDGKEKILTYRCTNDHEFEWLEGEALEGCRYIVKHTIDYWENLCGAPVEVINA